MDGLSRRPSVFQAGHIPSWRGSCERYGLSPVAVACRWSLLLLSPLLSAAIRPTGVRGCDQTVRLAREPIPAKARRDAVCCSVQCRQARYRFLRAVGHADSVAPGRPVRQGQADQRGPGADDEQRSAARERHERRLVPRSDLHALVRGSYRRLGGPATPRPGVIFPETGEIIRQAGPPPPVRTSGTGPEIIGRSLNLMFLIDSPVWWPIMVAHNGGPSDIHRALREAT